MIIGHEPNCKVEDGDKPGDKKAKLSLLFKSENKANIE